MNYDFKKVKKNLINSLKTKISLNSTYRCSSYGAVNRLLLGYNSKCVLYKEIIDTFVEIRSKHKCTLCGRKVKFLNAKTGDTFSNHWPLQC